MSRVNTLFFPFKGGENLIDPVLEMNPGELINSLNYECDASGGGYRRIDGFERFDGRTAPSSLLESSYDTRALWIDAMVSARSAITALPGSGPVRGVWKFNDITYGFRDNSGATACVMHKATASGWVAVTMDSVLTFTLGTNEISIGDTITGVTSSATATVTHVRINSGTWSGGDAEGDIYYNPSTLSGTFQAEVIQVSTVNSANIAGAGVVGAFPAGGYYEFINYNFYGLSYSKTMYGVNGVGQGFSFDGSDVIFIDTGTSVDTPSKIYAHAKQLFFAFPGGSVQHSAPGEPYIFSAILGSSEIAIGEECTGFATVPGESLAIFGRNNISILYGTGVADWKLFTYSTDSGAINKSIQSLGTPLFMDDQGIKKLIPSNIYGDFNVNVLSDKMKPYLETKLGSVNCSVKVRNKEQYRLFLDNQVILTLSMRNGKVIGMTRANLGKTFNVAVSCNSNAGEETLYAGDTDGYVYELDAGNNFDGSEIVAAIRPIFYHFKNPENYKRFIKAVLEISTEESMPMTFIPEFSYGDSYSPVAEEDDITITAGAGYWGSEYWEDFYWDSQSISTAYAYLTGIGKNFRMYIKSTGTYEKPHTLQGAIIHFSNKGRVK